MTSYLFFDGVKHTTIMSDMPNGSQKDNEASVFFAGQNRTLYFLKLAVGLASGVYYAGDKPV